MKFAVVILACVVAAAHAQFSNQYNRANAYSGFGNFQKAQPFRNQPFRSQAYKPYRPQPAVTVAPEPVDYSAGSPTPFPVPVVPYAKVYGGDARSANILKLSNEVNPDGTYSYYYETDNGIAAQEQGALRNLGGNPPVQSEVAQGSFSWTSPEGIPIAITYVADENGYQPQGAAIPTPPPVPPQIARALEYIARNAPRQ